MTLNLKKATEAAIALAGAVLLFAILWGGAYVIYSPTADGNSPLVGARRLAQILFTLVPPIAIVSATAWALRHIYSRRLSDTLPILYLKLAVGACTVPLFAAWGTLTHYTLAPSEYVVSQSTLSYFSDYVEEVERKERSSITANNGDISILRTVLDALSDSQFANDKIDLIKTDDCVADSAYKSEHDYTLNLAMDDKIVCIFYFPGPAKHTVERVVFQIRDMHTKEIRINFSGLAASHQRVCPVYGLFLIDERLRPSIAVEGLESCISEGIAGIRDSNSKIKERILRAAHYPPFLYRQMLLQELSSAVGAEFRIVKPVGTWAGLLSLVWSTLLAAYLFIFVAVALSRPGRQSEWD